MNRLERAAIFATFVWIPLLAFDALLAGKYGPTGLALTTKGYCVPVWADFSTGRSTYEGPWWFDITFMAIFWIAVVPPPTLWIAVVLRRFISKNVTMRPH